MGLGLLLLLFFSRTPSSEFMITNIVQNYVSKIAWAS